MAVPHSAVQPGVQTRVSLINQMHNNKCSACSCSITKDSVSCVLRLLLEGVSFAHLNSRCCFLEERRVAEIRHEGIASFE